MDVLDGKELVMPLNLSPEQAESFTTLEPTSLILMLGHRTIGDLALPVQAYAIDFAYSTWIVGMN